MIYSHFGRADKDFPARKVVVESFLVESEHEMNLFGQAKFAKAITY